MLTKAKREYPYYRMGNAPFNKICADVLSEYFDLSDNPATIVFRIEEFSHPESYYIKAVRRGGLCLDITLSDGQIIEEHIFSNVYYKIRKFKKGCYVSVMA